MEIIQLSRQTKKYNLQAAELLRKAFPLSYYDCAEKEIDNCLEEEKVGLLNCRGDTRCKRVRETRYMASKKYCTVVNGGSDRGI